MVENQYNPYNISNQGTSPTQGAYQNMSSPGNLNPTFGGSDQFNIPAGVIQPFNFGQQKAEQGNYLQGFNQFLQGQEKLPAIQDRLSNKYGIPDLRESYLRQREAGDMVGNQIRGIEGSTRDRFAESMLTQGQVDRVINKEAKGLLEQFNSLGQITEQTGQRLAMAEQNLNNEAKMEMMQMEKDTQPWLRAYDLMTISQAREFTGWTTTMSMELERLLANQAAGLQWTNNEAQRANALSIEEKSYQSALDQISATGEQNRQTQTAPKSSSLAEKLTAYAAYIKSME